jgi:hypothetical protein
MSEANWYEVVQGADLRQGDLLMDCPVFTLSVDAAYPLPPGYEPVIQAESYDLVILTQSCDLDNDKVEEVLLAPFAAWSETVRAGAERNPALRSREFRRGLIAGNIPGLSLLHKRDESPSLPWSVVSFHRLFTLSKAFLHQFAEARGPRLRLLPPYREHLAQALARYFMRVGLPHDAKAFELEGKVD